jgi:large subunit ribosomal protein L25
MEFTTLNVNKRMNTGKGAARRMRRTGFVPAIVYGLGVEALPVSVEPRAVQQALAGPMRLNTVLALRVTGDGATTELHAVVRSHQYHPVRRTLQHVDFLAIDVTKPLRVSVPLVRSGRAIGEQEGGILTQVFRDLPVECLPELIPAQIDVDVRELKVGSHVTVDELSLPEGVKVALAGNQSVFTVTMPKAEKVVETAAEGEAAEGAEGAPAAEGAEGAPAAEGGAADKKADKKAEKKE